MNAAVESNAPSATPERKGYGWIFNAAGILAVLLCLLLMVDRLYRPDKFQINRIEVNGNFVRVDGRQIKRVVEQAMDGNYFSVSLAHLEREIESLPWVFNASLRRRWPSTLSVEVVEVEPVARWGVDKWLHVTHDIVALDAYPGGVDLPLLEGPIEHKALIWEMFQHWSGLLAQPGLRLEALRLDTRGLWYLQLSRAGQRQHSPSPDAAQSARRAHRVALVVDENNADARLRRFVRAINPQLVSDFTAIDSIDLRYPNGFAIGWQPDAVNHDNRRVARDG